jgi:hypothetical protein
MNQVRHLLLLMTSTALLFLLLGLYRPVLVLWWEDIQNRRKVLYRYGRIAFICLMLYLLTALLSGLLAPAG